MRAALFRSDRALSGAKEVEFEIYDFQNTKMRAFSFDDLNKVTSSHLEMYLDYLNYYEVDNTFMPLTVGKYYILVNETFGLDSFERLMKDSLTSIRGEQETISNLWEFRDNISGVKRLLRS